MYVCVCVCVYVYSVHTFICMYSYVCIYICMYVCKNVCVPIYVCTLVTSEECVWWQNRTVLRMTEHKLCVVLVALLLLSQKSDVFVTSVAL